MPVPSACQYVLAQRIVPPSVSGMLCPELSNQPVGALKRMRAVSAADITELRAKLPAIAVCSAGSSVDGYVVPKPPLDVFAAGQEHRVGLLPGSNSRERVP